MGPEMKKPKKENEYRKMLKMALERWLQSVGWVFMLWILMEIGLALGTLEAPPDFSMTDRLGFLVIIAFLAVVCCALTTIFCAWELIRSAIPSSYRTVIKWFSERRDHEKEI